MQNTHEKIYSINSTFLLNSNIDREILECAVLFHYVLFIKFNNLNSNDFFYKIEDNSINFYAVDNIKQILNSNLLNTLQEQIISEFLKLKIKKYFDLLSPDYFKKISELYKSNNITKDILKLIEPDNNHNKQNKNKVKFYETLTQQELFETAFKQIETIEQYKNQYPFMQIDIPKLSEYNNLIQILIELKFTQNIDFFIFPVIFYNRIYVFFKNTEEISKFKNTNFYKNSMNKN
ncbi:hypothetical protein [Deferribacter desulfuricans]|nr:hypothetical protein [Deferribacter desulfuricans]